MFDLGLFILRPCKSDMHSVSLAKVVYQYMALNFDLCHMILSHDAGQWQQEAAPSVGYTRVDIW